MSNWIARVTALDGAVSVGNTHNSHLVQPGDSIMRGEPLNVPSNSWVTMQSLGGRTLYFGSDQCVDPELLEQVDAPLAVSGLSLSKSIVSFDCCHLNKLRLKANGVRIYFRMVSPGLYVGVADGVKAIQLSWQKRWLNEKSWLIYPIVHCYQQLELDERDLECLDEPLSIWVRDINDTVAIKLELSTGTICRLMGVFPHEVRLLSGEPASGNLLDKFMGTDGRYISVESVCYGGRVCPLPDSGVALICTENGRFVFSKSGGWHFIPAGAATAGTSNRFFYNVRDTQGEIHQIWFSIYFIEKPKACDYQVIVAEKLLNSAASITRNRWVTGSLMDYVNPSGGLLSHISRVSISINHCIYRQFTYHQSNAVVNEVVYSQDREVGRILLNMKTGEYVFLSSGIDLDQDVILNISYQVQNTDGIESEPDDSISSDLTITIINSWPDSHERAEPPVRYL